MRLSKRAVAVAAVVGVFGAGLVAAPQASAATAATGRSCGSGYSLNGFAYIHAGPGATDGPLIGKVYTYEKQLSATTADVCMFLNRVGPASGVAGTTMVKLTRKGTKDAVDSGNFKYYAGPVHKIRPGRSCVYEYNYMYYKGVKRSQGSGSGTCSG